MPRINQITPIEHAAMDPYHVVYDNLPLQTIVARQELINLAVDRSEEILRESVGTAGSLANRLNASINPDGTLQDEAVDLTLHNIGAHADGVHDEISYVRMLEDERDKLELISNEATALKIQFNTISTDVLFENETIEFENSDSISWSVTAPNIIKAEMAFDVAAAHQHYYDLVPVHVTLMTPDYTNYKVTSISTPYIEDSLRIYINGIRISESTAVMVYSVNPAETWVSTSFTSDPENGLFELNRAIDPDDIITIDFDISFV